MILQVGGTGPLDSHDCRTPKDSPGITWMDTTLNLKIWDPKEKNMAAPSTPMTDPWDDLYFLPTCSGFLW